MSSRFLHPGSDEGAEVARDAREESGGSGVRITVTVADRYTFDTEVVTGHQIKKTAGVPPGFVLYRRTREGNEPVADDERIELKSGDHFFARPSANAR